MRNLCTHCVKPVEISFQTRGNEHIFIHGTTPQLQPNRVKPHVFTRPTNNLFQPFPTAQNSSFQSVTQPIFPTIHSAYKNNNYSYK